MHSDHDRARAYVDLLLLLKLQRHAVDAVSQARLVAGAVVKHLHAIADAWTFRAQVEEISRHRAQPHSMQLWQLRVSVPAASVPQLRTCMCTHVPQVPAALLAGDLCAHHEQRRVHVLLHCALVGGQEEGGPTAPALELVVAQEQRGAAARALELARILHLVELATPRALRALLAQDLYTTRTRVSHVSMAINEYRSAACRGCIRLRCETNVASPLRSACVSATSQLESDRRCLKA